METTTTTTAVPPLELPRAPRKTPSLDLRDIPQAPGPEKGVLALMAMDPATYVGQCGTIGMTEDYFYLPAHKLLWRLFQARYNKNEPIDIVSITQALEDMHQLEAVGGSAGLAEIYTFTTTGAYFEHYLNVLKDKFILRSIIDIANQSRYGNAITAPRMNKAWPASLNRPSPILKNLSQAKAKSRD